MSRELELAGHRYWILSEPAGSGWKASVVELLGDDRLETEPIGIEAMAETRTAADEAAERKLRRLLQPSAKKSAWLSLGAPPDRHSIQH
jgi:hypothetical protein